MTGTPERGELLKELRASERDQKAIGHLRRGAAVVGGVASGALLLGRLPVAVALIGVTGVLVAAGWWRRGGRDVREAEERSSEPADGLWLYRRGLLCREQGEERWIPWAGVQRVAIDEEKLTVQLERGALPPVTLEPRYADVSIDELANALAEAAQAPGPYDGSQSRGDDLQ